MKIIYGLIFLIILLFSSLVNGDTASSSSGIPPSPAHFKIQGDCLTANGCDIFSDDKYWDNPTAFANPSNTHFYIETNEETTNIILNVSSITILSLTMSFSSANTVNILNSLITTDFFYAEQANINIVGGITSSITSGFTNIIGSTVTMRDGSSISTSETTTVPAGSSDIQIGEGSTVNVYDKSSISGRIIDLQGYFNLYNGSRVDSMTFKVGDSIFADINTSIKSDIILITSGNNNVILGSLDATQLLIGPTIAALTAPISVTLGGSGNNTQLELLELSSNSNLTIGSLLVPGNTFVSIVDASINGSIILTTQSSIRINPSKGIMTVGGSITMGDNTNAFFSNMIFPSGSLISRVTKQDGHSFTNVTIEHGFVDFLDSFEIYGEIALDNATTLSIIGEKNQLYVALCIVSSGSVEVGESSSVVCPHGDYYQTATGTLQMQSNSIIYILQMFSDGLILISGTNVVLSIQMLNSNGVFEIEPDCSTYVKGGVYFYETSVLDIGGIGPNTAEAALSVRDTVFLNGSFNYNISTPAENQDSTYYFISSKIELDGNFTLWVAEDFLIHYVYSFDFVNTQSSGSHPGSLQLTFNFAESPPHHINKFYIALAIILPLLFVGALTFGIYKYRKSRQHIEYTQLSDANDHIFSHDSSIDL